jgi:hypothetical protein
MAQIAEEYSNNTRCFTGRAIDIGGYPLLHDREMIVHFFAPQQLPIKFMGINGAIPLEEHWTRTPGMSWLTMEHIKKWVTRYGHTFSNTVNMEDKMMNLYYGIETLELNFCNPRSQGDEVPKFMNWINANKFFSSKNFNLLMKIYNSLGVDRVQGKFHSIKFFPSGNEFELQILPKSPIVISSSDKLNENNFIDLVGVCTVIYRYLVASRPNSCTVIRIQSVIESFSNEETDFKGMRIKPNLTTHPIYIRISKQRDISMVSIFYMTLELLWHYLDSQIEAYLDDLYPNRIVIGARINEILARFISPEKLGLAEIRSNDGKALDYYLEGYMTSPCPMMKICYQKLRKYLKKNKFIIISPRTYKNCMATALMMSASNITEVDKKTCARISKQMKGAPVNGNYIDILHWLGKFYFQSKFTVIDFGGNILKEIVSSGKHDKRLVYPNDNPHILVTRGHAFALVKGMNILSKNLIDTSPMRINSIQKWETKPSNFGTYDYETTADFVKAYCLGIYLGSTYAMFEGFDCTKQFFQYVLLNSQLFPSGIIWDLWAHNGGAFDNNFMIKEFSKNFWGRLKHSVVSNGTMLSITMIIPVRLFRSQGFESSEVRQKLLVESTYEEWKPSAVLKLKLRDSYPLLRSSLDSIGKGMDVEIKKKTGTIEYDKILNSNWKQEMELQPVKEYLEADCVCLYQVLLKFRDIIKEKFQVDPLKTLTLAALSRTIYFYHYYQDEMQNETILYKFGRLLDQKFRNAYYGGRTEAFEVGTFPGCYYYDVKSMYPWAMLQDVPIGIPIYLNKEPLGLEYLETHKGIVHLKIKGGFERATQGLNFHCMKSNNGLLFPYFQDWTDIWYWSEEIQFGSKLGVYEYKFIEMYIFQTAPILKKCVQTMFELKENNNENAPLRLIAKMIINSLYGIFALRTYDLMSTMVQTEWKEDCDPGLKYLEVEKLLQTKKLGFTHFLRVIEDLDTQYVSVPVAIAITSKARMHLYEGLVLGRKNGHKTLYCDTDSMITTRPIHLDIHDWDILHKNNPAYMGDWCPEFPDLRPREATVVAPKVYGFEGEFVKCKGFYKRFRWLEKSVDTEKKRINLKHPITQKVGENIEYKDLQMMNEGYEIVSQIWRFDSKTRQMFDKLKIKKEYLDIVIRRVIQKGQLDNEGIVQPLRILDASKQIINQVVIDSEGYHEEKIKMKKGYLPGVTMEIMESHELKEVIIPRNEINQEFHKRKRRRKNKKK